MLVDTHVHPISSDLARYPLGPAGGVQSEWSKGAMNDAESFLEHMARSGVDQAVLVQGSTVYGYDNSYVADCCAQYPRRFAGVVCVDPRAPDAPDQLSYWIQERGLHGSRIFATVGSDADNGWIDQPETYPYWVRAQELGIPVCIQARYTLIDSVDRVAERFPEVPVFLDHMSFPALDDGPPYEQAASLLRLGRLPNVHLKLTTNNILHAAQGRSSVEAFMATLFEQFSPARLCWGSNFPGTHGGPAEPYLEIVDVLRHRLHFLSADEWDWLCWRTAYQFFPSLAAGGGDQR